MQYLIHLIITFHNFIYKSVVWSYSVAYYRGINTTSNELVHTVLKLISIYIMFKIV